jgi:hypothetical protein
VRNLKARGSTWACSLAALAAASLAMPGSASAQASSYLDHEALTRELRALTQGSELVRMRSLAKTPGGRDVWVLEVGQPSGAPLGERPAVLVVGNLEGDHLVGSALALEGVRWLVGHASEEAVKAALETQVLYVFPRLNPDGAEAMFARVKWDRRGNGRAFDDDNDGRTDEDGPEDLNGDGYVTVMRVKDASGAYLADTADARVMKRADASKGESGAYTLYFEGTDEDGDGFINEDGPGGVDLNRNFQHEYPYWQRDAGPYMVSEAEGRALMDFVLAHRNVAAIVTFGESDNLVTPPDSKGALAAAKILELPSFAAASNEGVFEQGVFTSGPPQGFRGGGGGRGGGGSFLRGALPGANNNPSSGQRPATTVASEDQPYFKAVSDAYKRITGIQRVAVHRAPQGAFFQFGYFQYGVPSFSTPGWGLAAAEGGADAQILKGLDALGVQAFADWKAFRHPTLGDVEIGGFLPYVTSNPPASQLAELGEKHGRFLAELAGMLPRVRIAEAKVTAHGSGVFTVDVAVENAGFFPTSTQHGVTSSTVGPIQVQIQVDAADILTGSDKTVTVQKLGGSGAQERWTWVIRGRQGDRVEIKLRSEKGGTDLATVTLR